jgi:hypothetical protein
VAQWDTRKLQPLRDVVRQLLKAGLTGVDLRQSPHLATLAANGDNVDAPGARLLQPFLLH